MTWAEIFLLVYFGLLLLPLVILGLLFLIAGLLWIVYWFVVWLENPWVDRKAHLFEVWLCGLLEKLTAMINNHLARHGEKRGK
jgi:hypothetical protein